MTRAPPYAVYSSRFSDLIAHTTATTTARMMSLTGYYYNTLLLLYEFSFFHHTFHITAAHTER